MSKVDKEIDRLFLELEGGTQKYPKHLILQPKNMVGEYAHHYNHSISKHFRTTLGMGMDPFDGIVLTLKESKLVIYTLIPQPLNIPNTFAFSDINDGVCKVISLKDRIYSKKSIETIGDDRTTYQYPLIETSFNVEFLGFIDGQKLDVYLEECQFTREEPILGCLLPMLIKERFLTYNLPANYKEREPIVASLTQEFFDLLKKT